MAEISKDIIEVVGKTLLAIMRKRHTSLVNALKAQCGTKQSKIIDYTTNILSDFE